MATTLKIFCNQLYNLNETLYNRFPENKQLSLALTGVQTMKETNSKKLIEMFVLYAYKFKKDVMEKNEKFLLENDYLDDKKKDQENINIINTLKDNWKSLENSEKDNIWKYLQVLMKLTDKYLSETLKMD